VVVHCQGLVVSLPTHETEAAARLDLSALRAQCHRGLLSSAQCYQALQAMHMTCGPGHQGIDALYLGDPDTEHGTVQVLARLTLPAHLHADLHRFTLHPCLLDSALQASIGLSSLVVFPLPTSMPVLALPFAVEQVDIIGPCTPIMWAVLREAGPAGRIRKSDVDLCDEVGNVRVRIRGYASRGLEEGGKRRAEAGPAIASVAKPSTRGHPLIDADVSSVGEQVLAKCFTNRDSILRDHVFDGVRVLPAAAIIEMAREAVARTGAQPSQITNFLMGYPIVGTEQGIDTRLMLKPQGGHIDFSLSSRDQQSGEQLIHCQSSMQTGEWGDDGDSGTLDLNAIRARLPYRADLERDYDTVVPHAVEFGPTLRTLRELYHGEHEALAKIVVGEESRGTDFVLHPLIIDGAFQAGAVAYYRWRQGFQPSVLFSIDRL
jgi:Polyketide synthase dehydratase